MDAAQFRYELPANLYRQLGGADLLMCCSDYPHSEGTATPLADYAAPGKFGLTPEDAPGLFYNNAAFLLRRDCKVGDSAKGGMVVRTAKELMGHAFTCGCFDNIRPGNIHLADSLDHKYEVGYSGRVNGASGTGAHNN